jgi:hypothetical protein
MLGYWFIPLLLYPHSMSGGYIAITLSVRPFVHPFTLLKMSQLLLEEMILFFYTRLWHSDLYRVSPFQAYRTSTSCLQCDLVFFMFAVIKIL